MCMEGSLNIDSEGLKCSKIQSFSKNNKEFTVAGVNFPEDKSILNVTIGPNNCAVTQNSDTSIKCRLPEIYEAGEFQIAIQVNDYGPIKSEEYTTLTCPSNCRLCTLPTNCVECLSDWNLYKGRCSRVCPTGFNCSETSSEIYGPEVAFEFKPQGMQKVVTDPYNSIPVKAGTGTQFYPFFSENDPYPAKERGYYFKGSSYMRLPPYESTESPILVLAWEFSVSVWFKSETLQGTILSKTSNQTKVEIGLEDSLYSAVGGTTWYSSSTLDNSWTLAMVTVSNNPTTLRERVPSVFCQTEFEDTDRDFSFVIGANATLQNSFQGFIWELKAYKLPKNTPEFSLNCGNCTICPVELNECLPECRIDQFWDGEQCGDCLPNCKFGCINEHSCSLCGNDLCLECEFEECSSCVNNAFINPNSTCECERGYVEEYGFCNRATFSASLANEDNTLTLEFSETLNQTLKLSDFDLYTQNKSIEFEFTMNTLNTAKYELDLEFDSYVTKGEVILLEFRSQLLSESNFLLESLTLQTQLSFFNPDDQTTQEAQDTAQTTASIGGGVSGGAGMLSFNPSGVWQILNTIQILTYIPISTNPLTPTLRGHFKGLSISERIPKVINYSPDSTSSNTHYYSGEYGFNSNLFVLNAGGSITILLGLLGSWVLTWTISKIRIGCVQTASNFLLGKFKFSILIRYWIQTYLDLVIPCFIQFTSLPQVNIEVVSSFLVGCLFLILLSVTPLTLAIFLNSKKDQVQSDSTDSEFYKTWGSLFYEFKRDTTMRTLTYPVFTLKRLLFAASLILLSEFPLVQGVVNLLLMLGFLVFLVVVRPYKDKVTEATSFVVETGVTLIFGLVLYYLQEDLGDWGSTLETAILWISNGLMVIQSLAVVTRLILKLHSWCKRKSTPVEDISTQQNITSPYQETKESVPNPNPIQDNHEVHDFGISKHKD